MDFNFAKRGVANAGLTTGIIGTALGVLNGAGGLLGGVSPAMNCNPYISQYDAALSGRIAALESDVKLRDANIFTDEKLLEVYKYFDGQLKDVRERLCDQAVMNQKTADAFDMVRNDIVCTKNELYSAIARERDERVCSDNSIVTYVNNTFYPKAVADVSTETTTTTMGLYNPLPCFKSCNC